MGTDIMSPLLALQFHDTDQARAATTPKKATISTDRQAINGAPVLIGRGLLALRFHVARAATLHRIELVGLRPRRRSTNFSLQAAVPQVPEAQRA